MLAGEELRQSAGVDRAGVSGGLGRSTLAHGIGEPRQHRPKGGLARRCFVCEALQRLRGGLSIQPCFLRPGLRVRRSFPHNVSSWVLMRSSRGYPR